MTKRKSHEHPLWRGLDGMAYGYFMTVVLGNALLMIAHLTGWTELTSWAESMTHLVGPAVGIGIAYVVGGNGIVLLSGALAGMILENDHFTWMVCTYIAVMLACFVGNYIKEKTPFDIFVVPLVTIVTAGLINIFVQPYLVWLGQFFLYRLETIIHFPPLLMSMLLAVVISFLSVTPFMILPICTSLNLSGLAAGVAIAGTCSMTLGLMIMSLNDNEIGDALAVGMGGSLLQFKNVLKHPLILLPPLIASLICGLLSANVFGLMGMTSGVISVFNGMQSIISIMGNDAIFIALLVDGLLPIIITYSLDRALRKLNWMSKGDLKISRL